MIFLRRAIVMFASVLVFLVVAEGLLRAYGSLHQSYLVEMWRYGRNHKEFTGDDRSHAHMPNTSSRVMGQEVRIDRWGYRGADREVSTSGRRILALGDSITFGFGVSEQEAYPALLEKLVPGTQVWNAGVGNYNTAQELASLAQHLPRLKPTEVLLGFFINDLEPTQAGSRFLQGSLLFGIASQVWWSYGSRDRRNFLEYYSHWAEAGFADWTKTVIEGKRLLDREKIPLRVLLIPEFHSLGTDGLKGQYGKVRGALEEKGIPVCDGAKFFPTAKDGGRSYWAARDDSHPNADAHRILAQALVSCFYGAQ